MPISQFVWSLVAPMGFLTKDYADLTAFNTDVLAGNVQDPRSGWGHMLSPMGTAKPPIKINAVVTPEAPEVAFTIQQVSNSGPVTGFTLATYFFEGGRSFQNATGVHTETFPHMGMQLVHVVLNDGRRASISVDAGGAAAPVNTSIPTISGPNPPQVGVASSCSTGIWTGSPAPTYTRQWRAGEIDIAGATATSYTPVAGDVGKVLSCRVTATNSEGVVPVVSANTVAVIA